MGQGYSKAVKCLPGKCEALGSIPGTKTKKPNKRKKNIECFSLKIGNKEGGRGTQLYLT